jgi:hypothetical protein
MKCEDIVSIDVLNVSEIITYIPHWFKFMKLKRNILIEHFK